MGRKDWIFPIGEGISIDDENGLWSDGAFFDGQDIPIEWHPAEPAPNVADREIWKRWLEFLQTSPSAANTLLTVAKTRARAKAGRDVFRSEHKEVWEALSGTEAVNSDALESPVYLNWRFSVAMQFAFGLHYRQTRKGSSIPYIAHLVGVCALVLEAGGDEDQAIAALLHDAVEDQGGLSTLDTIHRVFGDRVALAVKSCSDSTASDPAKKLPWRERKEKYLAHLCSANRDALIVAAADKLHNARAVLSDYRELGERLWTRFNASGEDQLWYYCRLIEVLRSTSVPTILINELERVINQLERLMSEPGGP